MRSDGQELQTSASIGVCLFGDEEVGFDDLVRRADELCYEAKWQGRNRVVIGALRGASVPRGLLEPPAAPASAALREPD
jgi:predicted signal transduction protein with EAL and GGDEF domain